MKAYLSYLKLRFNVGLTYRFAAVSGIATQFFYGALYLMIYEAYFKVGIDTPMVWDQLVSYLWIQQAFLTLTWFNSIDTDIHDSIVTGQVSYEFVRPLNIYWLWFSKIFASKFAKVALRFWPVIIVAALLPTRYALGLPASFMAFILFIITLVLGTILAISFAMILYGLMFYTTSSKGLFSIYAVIADFFAGGVIPVPFMPGILRTAAYILPFRLIQDLPYRLYVGDISVSEGIVSMLIQIAWIGISIFIGSSILKNASKKLVVQGG